MEYIFTKTRMNYEDFASGKVLYNAHGTTSFPVRLASELVQRSFQILKNKGITEPYTLYDPCCGGGYLLTVIGLLHGSYIKRIVASDIDENVLVIAEKNLSLLFSEGIIKRKNQLEELIELYKKDSHIEALQSAINLEQLLTGSSVKDIACFQADITEFSNYTEKCSDINIIFADLPYGEIVSWKGKSADPANDFFETVYTITTDPGSYIVVVVADKSQKLSHSKFRRLQYGKIGKRHFGIFEPIN